MNFDRKLGLSMNEVIKNMIDRGQHEEVKEKIDELERKLNESFNENRKTKKGLTLNQQLLAMCYSGVMSEFYDLELPNTKLAKLIAVITNGSYDNIRQELSYLNPKRISDSRISTEDNLKKILPYFEDAGLEEIVEQISCDLNRIKKD